MNTTLKRGDIVKRYNDDKGIYQYGYGVVADTLIFLGNRYAISFMYREEAMRLNCNGKTVKKLMLCFIGCEIGCLCVVNIVYHTLN